VKLTTENYFSREAAQEYFSVSQYKDFCGTYGKRGCEEAALAKIRGEWEQEVTPSLLIGSFVDAHFEGTLDVFQAQHPEIFTKCGELKSEYRHALDIIARCERDTLFMTRMAGEKQVIFTGEIFGVPWKCKVDSLCSNAIVDLKVMESIHKSFWVRDLGHLSFVEYWGYNVQAAVYQKLVEINTGKKLPFLIAAASKEKEPDIEIIGFNQQNLDETLSLVFTNISRINDLKTGKAEPTRCERCDYCKRTKVLTKAVHYSELIGQGGPE
jgi:hypothetical protein